jgi:hypothetical protein
VSFEPHYANNSKQPRFKMSPIDKLIKLVLVCTCFSFHAASGETPDAQNASEIHRRFNGKLSQASKDGFSAMVFFTEDLDFPKKFHEGGNITLNATTSVRINTPFLLTVSFSGAGIQRGGDADIALDITITKPDGTIYFQAKDVPGWEGQFPYSQTSTQLAEGVVKLRIEPKDPPGRYTARVIVRDKVKGINLPIEKTFDATE